MSWPTIDRLVGRQLAEEEDDEEEDVLLGCGGFVDAVC